MSGKVYIDESFIKKLKDIIDSNLENEQFGVLELASEIGLSRSQLYRRLKEITGQSSSQFIREYRLQKAMEMLKLNEGTASEIGYRVGFSSPTYFNTSFNNFYGYPPGEVKHQKLKTPAKKSFTKKLISIIPVIILIGLIVYSQAFNKKNVDTTKKIEFTNDQGELTSVLITKQEFRKNFPIFGFDPKTEDSAYLWLEHGIGYLLDLDLSQNKNLNPTYYRARSTVDKVEAAKYYNDFYIDGEFEAIDNTYSITIFIRNAKNAKILKQQTFSGSNVLSLIDEMTVFITDESTQNKFDAPKYLDINIEDFKSSSLKAIEEFISGDYENAILEDSTFALAFLNYGKYNLLFNRSKIEERSLADKAFKYRRKLPLQLRGETLILRNLAYDQFEDAEQIIKIQLEVDPDEETYIHWLYTLYGRTKNLESYIDLANSNYDRNPTTRNGSYSLHANLINQDYKKPIKELERLELLMPSNTIFSYKLQPYMFGGDLVEAEKTLKKMNLLLPENKNITKVFDSAIVYLKEVEVTNQMRKKFEGEYQEDNFEQTYTFWVQNNTLLLYISNQLITPCLLAGENTIVGGAALLNRTWEYTFFKNNLNEYYAVKMEQNDRDKSDNFWLWRIDESIKKAEYLLDAKKLDSAQIAYTEAIEANPNHYYLKDVLAHIEYVKSIDSLTLTNQFKTVAGNYGPRKFWIDQGRFFYKQDNLARIELLPISENRYLSLSRLQFQYGFDFIDGNAVASYSYKYNYESREWEDMHGEKNNYFKRN